jgi:hypothetical protein
VLRLGALIGGLLATLAAVLSVFGGPAARRPPDPDALACAAAPSATCLAQYAVTLAQRGEALGYFRDASILPRLGLWDEAQALAAQQTAIAARSTRFAIASARIAADLRAGRTAAEAVAAVPDATSGNLHIAALDLLGRDPYGTSAPQHADAHLHAVAALADLLEPSAGGRSMTTDAVKAAELRALLGDAEGARRAFARRPTGVDVIAVSDDLARLLGPDTLLTLCAPDDGCRGRWLRKAAGAAPPDQARTLLSRAFDLGAQAPVFPDFGAMADTVEAALRIGHPKLALILATRMATLAQTRRGAFPAFPHIQSAQALIDAGAPADLVRASMDRALAEFPARSSTVVGFGLVAGPIAWGGGLGDQATGDLARLAARLGDADRAAGLARRIDPPKRGWQATLGAGIPVPVLERLLSMAEADLDRAAFDLLRARLAQDILIFVPADDTAPRRWAADLARQTASQTSHAGPGPVLFSIWSTLARAGAGANDAALRAAALDQVARVALAEGDVADLLTAAALWHDLSRAR